ncbi:hypothetical protein ACEWY4_026937 [Coilia grayii]|uniref:Polyadenylate-binding protein-interacting protein 2 n=1 Tax=Coilia grayii TaxID=363190 RepID=A0ABD1IV44_9TELE
MIFNQSIAIEFRLPTASLVQPETVNILLPPPLYPPSRPSLTGLEVGNTVVVLNTKTVYLEIIKVKMKDPGRSSSSGFKTSDIILNSQLNNEENPFAEYMWMENEEEFNRQIEEELWEEEFIERCFQEMLEEEEHEWFIPARDLPQTHSPLQDQLAALVIVDGLMFNDLVVNSNLNPNAKEFIPGVKY